MSSQSNDLTDVENPLHSALKTSTLETLLQARNPAILDLVNELKELRDR
jgi:hypothetical protein